jgi:multiple sugar transport system ATP-binding protein
MASITLSDLDKVYPGGVKAVDRLSLQVTDGEFMVFVGPSGCGKSTALRMVAGLEQISGGTVAIGDRVVNDVAPKDRDIAMVFQNYALYPHMTVEDNLGFGLRLRGASKEDRRRRVREAAEMLGLTDLLSRKPGALSGGQRQRVAMGRAIVREPQAFLMDEPLSNLDAKLRVSMRASLSQLHARLGTTTVYVTHDQVEAMTLGDRVTVLLDGQLQQVDTPQNLFEHPVNLFVAGFIGSPSMNFVTAELGRDGSPTIAFGGHALPLPAGLLEARPGLGRRLGQSIVVGLRPSALEDARLAADSGRPTLQVVADVVEELGDEIHVIFGLDAPHVTHDSLARHSDPAEEDELAISGRTSWTARIAANAAVRPGEPITLAVDTAKLHFFDPETGLALTESPA